MYFIKIPKKWKLSGIGIDPTLFLNGDEVLERLGHLAAGDGEVARVEEVADPVVVAVVGLGLGQLVVVVGELEVDAARVDVHRLAQDLRGHDGALDVPAGPAAAPGRLPARLARLRVLPDGEVVVGALLTVARDGQVALALLQRRLISKRLWDQLRVVVSRIGVELGHVEVDWRQLYKNKSSRKIYSQRLFSREWAKKPIEKPLEISYTGKTPKMGNLDMSQN